jgi:LacI family transcriptional regulator
VGSRGRVTLQTIAREVGLSKYAVSRSLAGKSGVSEETRERIREMAERLGYIKAPAQAVANDIAVVFHDLDPVNSELYMQIQNGVQGEAHRQGMGLRVHWTHSARQLEDLARACAGLLLVGPHDREAIAAATATGIPIVRFGWVDPLEQADQVSGTDHEAGQAVIQYLVDLGHRSIAYVYGVPGYRGRRERFYGAREIAEAHPDVALHVMQFDELGGFGEAYRALKETGMRPTAFFCAHDGLALTVVSELLGQGIAYPTTSRSSASVIFLRPPRSHHHLRPCAWKARNVAQSACASCLSVSSIRGNQAIPPAASISPRVLSNDARPARAGSLIGDSS